MNSEKKTKSPKGWQLVYYGPHKCRAYIKGSYTIRQCHDDIGRPIRTSWELLTGNRILAFRRTRAEIIRVAEEMMR